MKKAMPQNFADRLFDAVQAKRSCVVVGLDPRLEQLPAELQRKYPGAGQDLSAAAACFLEFGSRILDCVAAIVPAVKPQAAFFERLGPPGYQAYAELIAEARGQGLLVIADVKRNDIGTTAAAYAEAYLGPLGDSQLPAGLEVDAVTVSPYLGSDGILPFAEAARKHGKGLFVLVRTSNPSAGELQDFGTPGRKLYQDLADRVRRWGEALRGRRGYSSLGAVVGATFPEEARELRRQLPQVPFLVPGYGAQGGSTQDVAPCFNQDGLGAVVNASRSLIFAYRAGPESTGSGAPWERAVAQAARRMTEELRPLSPGL